MLLATPFLFACCAADADLSGLLKLPRSLHSLSVGGKAFGDAAMPVLAQLTQLEDLCVQKAPGFTDAGLQHLTSLELDRLYVSGCALSDAICAKHSIMLHGNAKQVSCTSTGTATQLCRVLF